MLSAEITLRAQFYDLDPMGVVWHGHYARFLEEARCALLDRIRYGYTEMRESGYAWPIVDLRVKYVRPVTFAQAIVVSAALVEYETRLRIAYRIRDAETGEVLTKAETIQVAVTAEGGELCLESPQALLDRVRSARS